MTAPVLTIRAPLSGVVVPLTDVPDEAFASGLAGDGVSLDPTSDELLAPCDARVTHVHRAGHALTLEAQGLEIMVHIGLDTVQLGGKGFTPLVRGGELVRAGDPLIRFDADLVARAARSLLTQVLVTSMDRVARITPQSGSVIAGRDALLTVEPRVPVGAMAAGTQAGPVLRSAPIVVRARAGLHARPAAMVAAEARRYRADLRLTTGDREANARSVVSIMALEVAAGEQVVVSAHGPDAAEAVASLSELLGRDLDQGRAGGADAVAPRRDAVAGPGRAPATDVLRGVPASPGVALGNVFQLRHDTVVVPRHAADPQREQRALMNALAAAHVELETLEARVADGGGEDRAAIFAAQRELLEDPDVVDPAIVAIREGASAPHAWQQAFGAQADRLWRLANPLLAARAVDLRDVGRRVLRLLAGDEAGAPEIPDDAVIVAEDLTPSDTATLDRSRVRGFCTTMGSATSHVAILARGLGIPAVAAIDPRALELPDGTRVLLDGDAGVVRVAPDAADIGAAVAKQEATARHRARDEAVAQEPATTRDGVRIAVAANLGDTAGASQVVAAGGEGVGLLRTEFLFMDRHRAPDEHEQARAYGSILSALGPERLLVVRTLDVGGDKPVPYLPMAPEANPFLGERGIRLTLNHPELFRAQVRAVLRVARSGRVAMMFPMIATMDEWRAAREIVEWERLALDAPPIQVGIMVETPAAALLAERFAEAADFFSIGTNDLTQYTLAMDRANPRLAPQVDALHPAVLHLIERTVAGARAHGRWVGVCGALAGDVQAVPVLLGLGVEELSADIPLVPAVKARVRALSLEACRATAREALQADDAAGVRALVAVRHPLTEHA